MLTSEKFREGVWHNLDSVMKLTMEELVSVNNITPDDCPDSELLVDVLLGTDSSGSHKQYAGKDIEIDSSNLEYGKLLENVPNICSKSIHILQFFRRCQAFFDSNQ